jgi:3'(2'), 5'-bisphosphate nucleotidase
MSLVNTLDMEFLAATAREAGAAILEVYNTAFNVDHKADKSPLTLADLRSHKVIAARLAAKYPGVPVLSEESTEHAPYEVRKRWPEFWLVDPLDGTKEFVKRNGQFTVNIALIANNRPQAGVVFAPALGLLYYAREGQAAVKAEDGQGQRALSRSAPVPAKRLVIAGSLSHPTPEMDAFVEEQRRKCEQVEFVAMGSSLKICLVADGSADIYPRLGPTMEWDTAAAHAIANACGRRVLRWGSDQDLAYNKPDLHNDWFVVK